MTHGHDLPVAETRSYPIRLSRRAFVAAGVGAAAAAMGRWQAEPDLVLHNGAIWTVSDRVPEVEAIAVSGGRIMAVGTSAEMLALAGARTRRLDLDKKRVRPGFYDAHAHPVLSGVEHLRNVACDKSSIEAIQKDIRERAAKTPAGKPVLGFLYDDGKTPQPLVTRTDYQGHTWGANQRITLKEVIRAGTLDGATASYEEHIKGTLEPGKLADLVVWDQDPLKTDPSQLVNVKVQRTMVGGQWMYES